MAMTKWPRSVAIIAALSSFAMSADAGALNGAGANTLDTMRRDPGRGKRQIAPACRGVGATCSAVPDCCEPWLCGIDRSGTVPKRCR